MVKVISLSEEAYRKLKAIKGNKSFSETVIGIVDERKEKKKSIMRFAGAFKDNAEYWKKVEKMIEEDRKKFKLRDYKW